MFRIPATLPFCCADFNSAAELNLTNFNPSVFFKAAYNSLAVSALFSSTTLKFCLPLPLPIKPNTIIKMKGNTKLNTIADGLLKMERRLAFVIASIARHWLYFINKILSCKTI